MTNEAEEPAEEATSTEAGDQDLGGTSVGDAPDPMVRGRSEDPPPDGVGFDGAPVDEILQDRKERLAPENRPENSEVDNTGRDFDDEKGMFTDDPGYEEAPKKFAPPGEIT